MKLEHAPPVATPVLDLPPASPVDHATEVHSISVLTLCGDRPQLLRNQWRGLLGGSILPHEWILVPLVGPAFAPDPAPFPISMLPVGSRKRITTRAEALDQAARSAAGDILVFLDEACIPHPRFLECMRRAVRSGPSLWKAQVRHLAPQFPTRRWYPEDLEQFGRCRSSEPPLALDELYVCDRCDFGSPPCFAMAKDSYLRLGGAETLERVFRNQGGDLPVVARSKGLGFGLSGARVYRQASARDSSALGCFA